jgi:hypothetical protein
MAAVAILIATFPDRFRPGCGIASISRNGAGATAVPFDGSEAVYAIIS